MSRALQNTIILLANFDKTVKKARAEDFVYLDPPYHPVSETALFTAYTKEGFGKKEQEKLAKVFSQLTSKGVHVLESNSDTRLIKKLYRDYAQVVVKAKRAISCDATKRGEINELLIKSY